MAKRYVLTAKRRAALKKAQLASARKRKGSGKSKWKGRAKTAGKVAAVAGALYVSGRVKSGRGLKKTDYSKPQGGTVRYKGSSLYPLGNSAARSARFQPAKNVYLRKVRKANHG